MNSSTRMAWPVNLEQQPDGSVLVSFPDIPQALTEGATIADALSEAEDCLIATLGGYINGLRDVPQPSAARGRPVVALSTLAASKIALYCAMRAQGLGNTALAQRLGTAEGTVRRLLNLDHRSHIGQLEAALKSLGTRLVITTRAA